MGLSPHSAMQTCLRVALIFAAPIGSLATLGDLQLAAILAVGSLMASFMDVFRQRRRCLPFPVLLLLVYSAQMTCFMVAMHGNVSISSSFSKVSPESGATLYPPAMPIRSISIVMAAHNEQLYLERTLDSIIGSTPADVLREIIVVDDASEPPLKPMLDKYPLVKVLRHEKRLGLIKSKTRGGNTAVSDMIMFLDAHVKPAKDWHLPLLRHMNRNYKRVVVPMIPILNGDNWVVNENAVGVKMMFDWTLFFQWFDDRNDLVPCMSGGLFGITRQWWHESGEYDYGMSMWGAENIEQSIRIWLCGGEIIVARDSRIAHVFRSKFPYTINNTEIYINKVRTVETWFDEYKEMVYQADPGALRVVPFMGNISDRLAPYCTTTHVGMVFACQFA
ncbi:unnamed protein product [Polarella glacialis]|uniref:Glycosyltransferase 2-like domain-containing protein n=1 Tax=Polarella glacialis TaxID=89957 RepID=A0A813DJA2_POLGL|nr:unnamed protein product [Polarella glacialis]